MCDRSRLVEQALDAHARRAAQRVGLVARKSAGGQAASITTAASCLSIRTAMWLSMAGATISPRNTSSTTASPMTGARREAGAPQRLLVRQHRTTIDRVAKALLRHKTLTAQSWRN
jgi:hypothetical protein